MGTCTEGATRPCDNGGTDHCVSAQVGPAFWFGCESPSATSTPLILSFDGGDAIARPTRGTFDLEPAMSVATDWPTEATPWLALDRNGNGLIDNGGELFGSATPLVNGGFGANGFIALRELDDNHDGRITPDDRAYEKLVIWSDQNGDRQTQPGEIQSLRERGIDALVLEFTIHPSCDSRGNCEIEVATFAYHDRMGGVHRGRLADLHLPHR
jgi:hypothetical protein